jgi:hypothetical protein
VAIPLDLQGGLAVQSHVQPNKRPRGLRYAD